jgi:large subunit ribosomal protein L18
VFRSHKHISAQIINDEIGRTLVSATDMKLEAKGLKPVEIATKIGSELAHKAKAAGITAVVFDRGGYRFHGRVKAVAEAARAGGLEF